MKIIDFKENDDNTKLLLMKFARIIHCRRWTQKSLFIRHLILKYVCEIYKDLKNATNEKESHLTVSSKFRNQDRHRRLSAQLLGARFVKSQMNSATLR